MGSLTINGSGGSLRINYNETVNESAGTSLITVTSIQAKVNTSNTNVLIIPWGYISLGGTTLTLNDANQGICANSNSYGSFTNIGSLSAVVTNNGTTSTAQFVLAAGTGESTFNIAYGPGYVEGTAGIPTGTHSFALTPYISNSVSTISATTPVSLGSTCTISINAVKTSYRHTLEYSFDRSNWTTIVSKTSSTSVSWDTSTITSYFSDTSKRTVYIKCTTYNGNDVLGTDDITVVVNDSAALNITSISVTPINDNTTVAGWNSDSISHGNGYIFLQGYTRLSIQAQYTLSQGTSLQSVSININGVTYRNATFSNGTITYATAEAVSDSGNIPIIVSAVDSRNVTAMESTTVSIYAYSKPYATAYDAHRYSSAVNTKDNAGKNISAKATVRCTSVNSYNSVGVKVRYKASGGSYPTSTVTLTSGATNYKKINGSTVLSAEQSYVVQFIIYDALHTESTDPTTIEVIITTNSVTLHSADGGTGIALGGYNTANAADGYSRIEMWLNTYFYNKIIIPDSMYGSEDPSPANAIVGQLYFQILD